MTENNSVTRLEFDDPQLANDLFGPKSINLHNLQEKSGLAISSRGSSLLLEGSPEERKLIGNLLTQLYSLLKNGNPIYPRDVLYAYGMLTKDPATDLQKIFRDSVFIASPKRTITPKTLTQRDYIASMRDYEMVFAVGPAGTGKTYLAVALALSMLMSKKVKKVILTRPAVEAGERLGFLPGDLAQKINPYLRPLYDAMHDMLDFSKVAEMMDVGIIEVAPLAFMRGRTLSDAFIILDEAQNTTPEQMKMFLTRMGFGSHVAVTGDITQIDLPGAGGPNRSGLVQAMNILSDVKGIKHIKFTQDDVIRHPLVGRIVQAYEKQSPSA